MKKLLFLNFCFLFFTNQSFSGERLNTLSGKYSEIPGSEKIFINIKNARSNKVLGRVRVNTTFEDYGYKVDEIRDAYIFDSQRFGRKEIFVSHNIFPMLPIIPAFDFGPYAHPVLEQMTENNFVALFLWSKKLTPSMSLHTAENHILDLERFSFEESSGWLKDNSACTSYRVGSGQEINFIKSNQSYGNVKSSERIIYYLSSHSQRDERCVGNLLVELKRKLLKGKISNRLEGINMLEDALIAAAHSQISNLELRGIKLINPLNFKERQSADFIEVERVVDLKKNDY